MAQFTAYISRGLCNPLLIFLRTNGPNGNPLTHVRSQLLLYWNSLDCWRFDLRTTITTVRCWTATMWKHHKCESVCVHKCTLQSYGFLLGRLLDFESAVTEHRPKELCGILSHIYVGILGKLCGKYRKLCCELCNIMQDCLIFHKC